MAASSPHADHEDIALLLAPRLLLLTETKQENHDANAVKLRDDIPFFFPPAIALN